MDKETLEFRSEMFADKEARTVKGLVYPTGAVAERDGYQLTFSDQSISFGDKTPLLMYHDPSRPVGSLKSATWTARGLEAEFSVAKTAAGDEALELAASGINGFSVNVRIPKDKASVKKNLMTVSEAFATEVSMTPIPAFAGADVDEVHFSKEEGSPMAELDTAALVAAIKEGNAELVEKFQSRPVEVPIAVTAVNEPSPYAFDGGSGEHNLIKDGFAAAKGDSSAAQRIETFFNEKFVTQANVSSLTPAGFRSDLYVAARPARPRILGSLVSGGTLADLNPFVVPRYASSGTLVAAHTEDVEPSLATFTTDSQTINPSALSGKAAFTRELVDKAGPQVEAMVWDRMLAASTTQAEARLATMLDGLTGLTTIALGTAVNAALITAFDNGILGLAEPERFSTVAAASNLFQALYGALDTTGRKLTSAGSGQNESGTNSGITSMSIDGMTVVRSRTTTASYLIDPNCVFQWLSTPRRLDFDIEVRRVYMGFWQYSAEAVIDTSGIVKVTYAG